MTNKRSKLIEMLEHLIADTEWSDIVDLTPQDAKDILSLLKEQEAVKPIKSKLSFTHGFNWDIWDCGCCGNQLRSFAKYCDQCGKAVKWDECNGL